MMMKHVTEVLYLAFMAFQCDAFTPTHVTPNVLINPEDTRLHVVRKNNVEQEKSRRTFLGKVSRDVLFGITTISIGLETVLPNSATAVPSSVDYKAVAADIKNLIADDGNKGPTLVRLAWHSSGTYDKMSKTGGSGQGTIRFKEELAHGGNAGLGETAVTWLEPLKEKYGDGLSYADLYTLGGVVAIKTMHGPTIPWSSGRVDAIDASAVTPDGRLPNADSGPPGSDPSDAEHLRKIFGRMGFSDQEIVALSGAHSLGRCHTTASGYDGPWSPQPTTFNNLYFTLLSSVPWTKRNWDGPFQYEDTGKTLMMLPTDLVLIQDKKFKKYVDLYAKNQLKFFDDFTAAFQKLEELGTSNLVPTSYA